MKSIPWLLTASLFLIHTQLEKVYATDHTLEANLNVKKKEVKPPVLVSQGVSCVRLMNFIIDNGYKVGEVSSFQLIRSSWLKSVVAIEYKEVIYVIAEIKRDRLGYQTQHYIFCNVPRRNWNAFSNIYDMQHSYGERFNAYIIDYECDCE